jgi:hypothetical protein
LLRLSTAGGTSAWRWSTANQSATAAAAAIAGLSIISHLRIADPELEAGTGVVRTMTASIDWHRAHVEA